VVVLSLSFLGRCNIWKCRGQNQDGSALVASWSPAVRRPHSFQALHVRLLQDQERGQGCVRTWGQRAVETAPLERRLSTASADRRPAPTGVHAGGHPAECPPGATSVAVRESRPKRRALPVGSQRIAMRTTTAVYYVVTDDPSLRSGQAWARPP
jgi:hypothetical protein